MKDIKPTWFLQDPIDSEHKQYVLLDFLKSVNEDIKKDNIYHPIKKIFSTIKELTLMKRVIEKGEVEFEFLNKREKMILSYYENLIATKEEVDEIKNIIDISLASLYRYADLGTSLWKNIENRIKAFELCPDYKKNTFGVLILRNMATDEIHPYWWSKGESKESGPGVMMKKIPLLNSYYSLSYEFLIHELVNTIGIKHIEGPRVTIMEISEDFNKDSVILKVAKELFIREMESTKN
jgi:hypothetical protein